MFGLRNRRKIKNNPVRTLSRRWKPVFETLEDRTVPTVQFVGGPLTAPQNRADIATGLTSGTTEPMITVDPSDPTHVIVSNQGNLFVTTNGTASFSSSVNFGSYLPVGSTGSSGDTDTVFDGSGRVYWTNLVRYATRRDVGITQINATTGAQIGTTTAPVNAGNKTDDKQFLAANTNSASPFFNNLYVCWQRFGQNAGQEWEVFVSRSTDQGATWSNPIKVSGTLAAEGFTWPSDVSVAPNGDVFVAYHSQPDIVDNQLEGNAPANPNGTSGQTFVVRYDGALNFISKSAAFTPGQSDVTYNRQDAPTGNLPGYNFWMSGAPQPWVMADAIRPNNVYVVTADDPDNMHGSGDDSDVVFARSTDNGANWVRSTITSGPANSHQLFPTASIDQYGNIVVAWYDSRNNVANQLDVFATYSTDGGLTWAAPFQINDAGNALTTVTAGTSQRFAGPPNTLRIGEYFGITVNAGTAYVAWNGNTFNSGNPVGHQAYVSSFAIAGTATIDATNGDDTILVRRLASNNQFIQVLVNGIQQYAGLAEGLTLVINGLNGNDQLTVDESNGVVNVPITFNGGSPVYPTTPGDSILVTGGSFANLVYNATGIGAGNINLDGNLLTFTSTEPVTVVSALGNVTINLTDAAAHTITLGDDGTLNNNLSKVTIDAGIESLTFTNPTNTLAFAGNNNNNLIILNALDTATLTPTINLVGGPINDEFRITTLRNGQSVNVLANAGTDSVVVGGSSLATFNTGSAAANLANVLGTVNVLANSSSTVYIDDSGFVGGRTITSDDIPSMPFFITQGVHTTAIGLTTAINVNNGAREVQTAAGAGNDTFRVNTTLVANYSAGTTETFFGNNGNDNFFVRPSTSAGIFVFGGSPAVGDPGVPPNGDRLVVFAYGATVNPLFSSDGLVSAPGFVPVTFNNIEFVSVPDRFEINDTPSQATFLGSDPFVTLRDLSIHSVDDPSTPLVNEADIDYFRYVAHDTGYLTINIQYLSIVGGQLVVEVYRPTSLANLTGPNVPGAPFNNNANYVTTAPAAVGTIDGTTLNIPVVKGQIYYIKVRGSNQQQDAGNYNLEIENFAAAVPTVVNLPANLPLSAIGTNDNDTGRSNTDGITNNNRPYFIIQDDLRDLANAGVVMLTAAQATAGQTAGAAVEVYVRTFAGVPIATFFAEPVAGSDNTLWSIRTTTLPDGNYQITASTVIFDNNSPNGLAAEVKRSGRTQFGSPPLNFTIDTVAPASPSFVLNPLDDTGIPGQPNTYVDLITKNAGANFTGNAEAAAWMQFYAVDRNFIPQFGGTAYANAFGQYFIDPTFNLNDPTFFDQDGERLLFSTATDVAGNLSAPQTLLIFLDTRGPQVAGVTYRYDQNGTPIVVDLLNQTIDGVKVALPQINYIDVTLIDRPNRTDLFLYPAANPRDPNLPGLATTPGNYAIIGKRTGNQTIDHVEVLQDDTVSGGSGLTTYRLFLVKPLPDDRFTFKVFDRIQDEAGNALDGDFQPPALPSGDGVPGGNFVVQFITVDSRAELGFYANGAANLDLNGDFIVNPGSLVGDDAIIPYAPNGAAVFSGQFYDPLVGTVDGFDRLGTYGKQGTRYVFRLDFNNDGDFTDAGETTIQTSLQINGLPISGNWGPSAVNLLTGRLTGSNVGVFDGTTWYLDTNGNNIIETAAAGDRVLKGNMKGLPFTGDFDGDGLTDLGTYLNGVFYIDLTMLDFGGFVTGFSNYNFRATLPLQTSGTASKLARPVAADFDGDGITDIGLFIPNQTTVPSGQANWFLMNSNYTPWDLAVASGTVRGFKNAATGFGNDIAATYGSAKALPVVGNFDPSQNLKPTATAAAKAAAQSAAANLAHNLADMYFEGTDSTDFVLRTLRKGKGR